jgi:hypothetical protein
MPRVTGEETGTNAIGVVGIAAGQNAIGLRADGETNGVSAFSKNGEAVHAHTESANVASVAAFNINPDGIGAAVFAEKKGDKGHAGFFAGNVHITRNLSVEGDIALANVADFAEDFAVTAGLRTASARAAADIATGTATDAEAVEPGTVMVLADEETLRPSDKPYDRRVVGVVSGAGAYRPGIVLDKRPGVPGRVPIALLGKVYCKVDGDFGPIAVGDPLTTSPTVGHAMRVSDPHSALGAVLGKAMRALPSGRGAIPVLVTLQ